MNRAHGLNRLAIYFGSDPGIPSFDHMSAGQATLFAMVATIARYAERQDIANNWGTYEGIVIIDEIDAHIHADLQFDALPKLLKLFPKIQFVLSAHAPLFLLGMRKEFGDDGFTLIEMPSGLTIDAERFSEFERSLSHFRTTKAFDNVVEQAIKVGEQPLILCEGATDPTYLKTAADLLGFEFTKQIEIKSLGESSAEGSLGAGKDNLSKAFSFLKHNPQFLKRKVVLLFDADAKRPNESEDFLFIRSLPKNSENDEYPDGIENLLPKEVFEEKFFDFRTTRRGGNKVQTWTLRKKDLCEHLCNVIRNPTHFEKFRVPLEDLRALLFPAEAPP